MESAPARLLRPYVAGQRRARHMWATVACACLVTVASACGSGGDSAQGPATTSSGGTATPGPTPVERCAWAVRADRETLNIAYPDAAATYWAMSYQLAPGEHLVLHGTFPAARYASFITYGANGGAIDVLADRDIVADAGTANPFGAGADASTAYGTYTLTISGDSIAPPGPNVLDARSDGTSSTAPGGSTTAGTSGVGSSVPSTTAAVSSSVPRIGSGGDGAVGGVVIYRIYVPDEAKDPAGGVSLPAVTLDDEAGKSAPVPTCANPGASPDAGALVERNGPATDKPAPKEPIFIRPAAGAATLFPNPDNIYVATILEHRPGQVVVVRAKAPAFPTTTAGRRVGGGEQVRYWSMCTNEYRKPYPVTACATDAETALDASGWFTYVISTAAERPANATAANGITWLDWGSTEVNVLLLARHMLADPSFTGSATNLAPGSLATSTMGEYAPRGLYCSKEDFEQNSPACTLP